jgi:hypothetical protein
MSRRFHVPLSWGMTLRHEGGRLGRSASCSFEVPASDFKKKNIKKCHFMYTDKKENKVFLIYK